MSYRYLVDMDTYDKWKFEYRLPEYNFAPWGWRSQCYILGIMTGYILWLTKDKKVVIDRKLNVIIWFNAILLGLLLVYRSYRDFRWETGKELDLLEGRYTVQYSTHYSTQYSTGPSTLSARLAGASV